MSDLRMTALVQKLRLQPKSLGIAAMDLDVIEYGVKALGENHVAQIWLSAPTRFDSRDRVLWTAEVLHKQLPQRETATNRFDDLTAERNRQNALERLMKYHGVDPEIVSAFDETTVNPSPGSGSSGPKNRKDKKGKRSGSHSNSVGCLPPIADEDRSLLNRIASDYDRRIA